MYRFRNQPILLILATAVGLAVSLPVVVGMIRESPCRLDFNNLYAGGKLAFSDSLYSRDAERHIYRAIIGCSSYDLPYVRPAIHAAPFALIAKLPYSLALPLWFTVCVAAVVVFVLTWNPQPWSAAAVVAWSFPLAMSFTIAQDMPLILLSVGGAFWAYESRRTCLAASFLLLGAAKPHLLLVFGLWLVIHRPKRLLLFLLIGSTALFLLSMWAAGPAWIPSWLHAASHPEANLAKNAMISFFGLQNALGLPSWFSPVSGVLLLGWTATTFRRMDFRLALFISPLIGLLLSPHSYLYDSVCCIPLLVLTLQDRTAVFLKIVALMLCVPATYLIGSPHLSWWAQALFPILATGWLLQSNSRHLRLPPSSPPNPLPPLRRSLL